MERDDELNSQIALNGELLAQLREKEHFEHKINREMARKHDALLTALEACERSKIDVQNQEADKVSAQNAAYALAEEKKRIVVELESFKQENHALRKHASETESKYEELFGKFSYFEKENNKLKIEIEKLKKDLSGANQIEESRVVKLKNELEIISLERNKLQTRIKPLEFEVESEKRKKNELTREINALKRENQSMQQENDKLKKQVSDSDIRKADLDRREREIEKEMEKERELIVVKERNLQQLERNVHSNEITITKTKREADDLKQKNIELQKKLTSCEAELHNLSNDLLSQAQSRGNEKKMLSDKINELRTELMKSNETFKLREIEQTKEIEIKIKEFNEIRNTLEETILNLQKEQKKLQELISNLQIENKENLSEFQRERDNFNSSLHDLKNKLKDIQVQKSILESDHTREVSELNIKLKDINHENVILLQEFNKEITMVKNSLNLVIDENNSLQNCYNEAIEEVNNLMSEIESNRDLDENQLNSWNKEIEKNLILVFEDNLKLKEKCNSINEQIVKLNVERDSEITKSMMLEEEINSLKDDILQKNTSITTLQLSIEEKVKQITLEKNSSKEVLDSNYIKSNNLKKELEEANQRNNKLLEEKQKFLDELKLNQQNTRLLNNRKEQEIEQLDDKYREIMKEKNNLISEMEIIKQSLKEEKITVEDCKSELNRKNKGLYDQNVNFIEKNKKLEQENKNLKEKSRNYLKQVNHQKGLINVMQENNKSLKEENLVLRGEMDETLKSRLSLQPVSPRSSLIPTQEEHEEDEVEQGLETLKQVAQEIRK